MIQKNSSIHRCFQGDLKLPGFATPFATPLLYQFKETNRQSYRKQI